MKKFLLVLLVCFAFAATITEAKSFQNGKEKRFFTSWINNAINTIGNAITDAGNAIVNNVINPVINNVVNPVVDVVGGAINTIGNININDVLNTVWKPIESTAVDAFNQAVNGVNTVVDAVGNIVSSLSGSGSGGQPGQPEPDFCNLRCQAKNQNGDIFFYDQVNGCTSKGFASVPYSGFNTCCDLHNQCLNSKCCTSNCQTLKDDCDVEYKRCLRTVCNAISNFDLADKCIAQANAVSSYASASKCNPSESRNRKLCIC